MLFIITPWNFFYARTGYELYLGFLLFSLAGLLLWLGLSSKKLLIPGIIMLSLSTYGSYPQIFAVPLFFAGFLALFFRSIDKKYLLVGIILAAFIQIPHLMIAGSSAVGSKGDLFYIGEINNSAAKIPLPYGISFALSLCFSVLARVVNYFSPNSLFFFPDPDPQRSMPEVSVFYNWMVVPFFIGIYILFKNLKDRFSRVLLLLAFATVMPAALTKDPFSTQRALPLLLPLFLIISLGISKIYQSIGFRKFLLISGVVFLISTIMLWRSYFVLLPAERGIVWGYGYKDLAEYILSHPEKHFVIEQTLGKPAYSNLAFYLKTDPAILQSSRDPEIKEDYYNLVDFNPDVSFANIETRTVVWEKDIYKDQILIGNELAISKNQAQEHYLTEVFKTRDPRGYPIFFGYQTNPVKKCENTNNASALCQ